MKNTIVIFFPLFILINNLFAQTYAEMGTPFMRHYTYRDYGAGSQIYCCTKDKRGIIFLGHDSGMLEFDGNTWRQISLPKNTPVRSMAVDSTGRVYVGSYNEFGYLQPNNSGEMQYISLAAHLPENERKFNNAWKTFINASGVYFISRTCIFRYYQNKITAIKVELKAYFAAQVNDDIYIFHKTKELCLVKDTNYIQLKCFENYSRILKTIISFPNNKLLVNKSNSKMQLYDIATCKFEDFSTPAQEYFEKNEIFYFERIDDSKFAVVTKTGEIVILSNNGEFLQIINKKSGLNKAYITSLFVDDCKNLWACTGKGVKKIDINYPIVKFDADKNISETVVSTCEFGKRRYVGTFGGIYYLPDFFESKTYNSKFIKINSHKTDCMAMLKFNDMLFATGVNELIAIQDTLKKTLLSFPQKNGNCLELSKLFPDILFIGIANNFGYVKLNSSATFKNVRVVEYYNFPEITDEIAKINTDSNGNLWINTKFNGIYFIRFYDSDIKKYKITHLAKQNGLKNLDATYTSIIDNKILVATNDGLLETETPTGYTPDSLIRFKSSTFFGKFIKENVREIIKLDENKYLIHGNSIYYATKTATGFSFDSAVFNRLVKADQIYFVSKNENNSLSFGASETYFYYNTNAEYNFAKPFHTAIRKIILNNDSILFNGSFYHSVDTNKIVTLQQTPEFKPLIHYKYNSIVIQFSGLFYEEPQETEYQYQLEGRDEAWSSWTTKNEAVYTNLIEGNYTFKVKAKNVYGIESEITEYEFKILPPFYRTWWAYIIYTFLTFLSILSILKYYTRLLRKQKEYLEKVVKERTQQLSEANEDLNQQKEEIQTQAELLRTQNDKLLKLDEFKQSMTSMIVHDLKNPLNAIINTPEKYSKEEKLEIKTQYGRQMLNLVMNILDVNKYEETRMTLDLQSVSLFGISVKAISQVQFLANEKNITIVNNINQTIAVTVDAEIIERVFVNLLTNAIKYSNSNSEILIETERSQPSNHIIVKITNFGMGIPKDKRHLVFQKFGQVAAKKSGGVRSTGIGLTFCKLAIEAHGCEINFESDDGNGTTFWFTLHKDQDIENVQIVETKIPKTITGIELHDEEKAYLLQFTNELKKCEIYEITVLLNIIEQIEDKSEQIKLWKNDLIKIINNFDEDGYKKQLNINR